MICRYCNHEYEGDDPLCPECDRRAFTSNSPTKGWQEATTYAPLATGEVFAGRYTIVDEVGAGGMSSVYKARDAQTHRTVALKLLRPEVAAQWIGVERFRREMSFAERVDHRNVCRVFDLGEVDDARFLSMEYVDGQPLRDLIQSVGQLSPRQTISLGRQICGGLTAIHACSIVHRDLKPANIMIDRSGRAVVMDFGLAHQHDADTITSDGEVLGTLAYLTPEQAAGQPVDARTDVYALGLVLFEMLTGKRPPGDEGRAPLALRPDTECSPPSQFAPDVPAALDDIVLRCLDRDPAARYQNAAELDEALAGVEISGSMSRAALVPPPLGPRRVHVWAALAALSIVVGVSLLVGSRWSKPPPLSKSVAWLPLQYSGPEETAYLRHLIPLVLSDEIRGTETIDVVPFASSRSFSSDEPPQEVAGQLGSSHLVRGRVTVSDGRVDTSLELLDQEGTTLWQLGWDSSVPTALDDVSSVTAGLAEALGAPMTPGIPRRDPAALAAYSEGRAFLEGWDVEENYSKAEQSFERAIDIEPDFAEAHAGLARALWQRYRVTRDPGVVARTLATAERSVALDASLPEAHLALGVVLLGTGRSAEAAESLRRAREIAPGDDAICRVIAGTFAALNRDDEAEQMFQLAITLRPGYWENYNSKGLFHLRRGQIDAAQEMFRRVIDQRPESDTGYNNLATSYILGGELDQAEPLLRAALAIQPDPSAHDNLGFIYYSTERFDRAAEQFRAAIAAGHDDALSWGNLGDALRQLKEAPQAREAYQTAIARAEAALEVNPKDSDTRVGYAMYLAGVGRCADVEGNVSTVLTDEPARADLHYYAALAFAVCGRREDAVAHAVEAVRGGIEADVRRNPDLKPLLSEPALQRALSGS